MGRRPAVKPLRRPCSRCGKVFQPTARRGRICPQCDRSNLWREK